MEGKLQTEGQPLEPYRDLLTNSKGPIAHVTMSVGFSKEYGAMKVSASVSLACDQNEKSINKAGERAFDKAAELVEDGWRELEQRMKASAESATGR